MNLQRLLINAELRDARGAFIEGWQAVKPDECWEIAEHISAERHERIYVYVQGEQIGSVFNGLEHRV